MSSIMEVVDRYTSRTLPYKVKVPSGQNSHKHFEQVCWCTQHFGNRYSVQHTEGLWSSIWIDKLNNYYWYFKKEEDYLLFTLRWL